MSLQSLVRELSQSVCDLSERLQVPAGQGQVLRLFSDAIDAIKKIKSNEELNRLIAKLGESIDSFNPNLSDLKSIADIQIGQKYNLPGGGTVELTKENGVRIIGKFMDDGTRQVNVKALEKFCNGTKGTFNLVDLQQLSRPSVYDEQNLEGIYVEDSVRDHGFMLSHETSERLVGGDKNLPQESNATLLAVAMQFLKAFQTEYQTTGYVAARIAGGGAVDVNVDDGVMKCAITRANNSIGTLKLLPL